MGTAQLGSLLRYVHKLAAGRGASQRTDRDLLDDFSARRNEAAFAALVARHGPMVLRVCQRVLGHEQDAEDAFQATFLILVRKSGSIRKREAIAQWLHGVAYRTAIELKRGAARRRDHEARLWTVMRKAAVSPTWDDVRAVLDEEIQRLPDAYRAAFVLFVLEGKSGPQAAAELGIKEGAVWMRLTRARQLLQRRLTRRGIKLAAVLAALAVTDSAAQAGVSAALAHATIRFGLLVAAGESAAGVIPSHVAALAAGVTRAMFLTKAKIAVALLFAVGLVAAGASVMTCQALAAKETPPVAQKSEPPAKGETKPQTAGTADAVKDKKGDTFAFSGRVLDPDGKPFAGAKVYLTRSSVYTERPDPSLSKLYAQFYATTAADGSFTLTVPKVPKEPPFPDEVIDIAATAKNIGVAFARVSRDGDNRNVTLKLVKDDVAIKGQIVDLQGKPVQGAKVRVLQIAAAAKEDLGPWLEAVKAKKALSDALERQYLGQRLVSAEVPALANQVVTTGADGRFRLTGIGRERLAIVRVEGPAIATEQLRILTRVGKNIAVPTEAEVTYAQPEYNLATADSYYHAASFRHVAAATTPIVGIVRDRDTNKPLAGVTIRSLKLAHKPRRTYDFVQTTSDEQGRYRLTGMPKGEGNQVLLVPRDDQPYLKVPVDVPEGVGLDPVTVDIQVKRGVWIEGKVTDKATGKPVRRGTVAYSALANNPYWRNYPGIQSFGPVKHIREDGTFRIVGLPGPGVLTVSSSDQYLATSQRDDADGGPKEGEDLERGAIPGLIQWHIYNAVARIDPPKEAEKVTRDIKLDPGETFNGTLVGPDGKPVSEASTFGLTNWNVPPGVEKGSFTVRAFNPRHPRPVLFHNAEKRLVGALELPKDKSQPVAVKLQPGATATGRLVGADGQPRANVELRLMWRPFGGTRRAFGVDSSIPYFSYEIKTDQQGRFRIDTLLPGLEYFLGAPGVSLQFGEGLLSGETKDLGDVQMK